MRVALVHDWLITFGGAERVLSEFVRLYPGADIFTSVAHLAPEDRQRLGEVRIHTTFLQRWPGVRSHYRHYLPLLPIAIEQIDLRGYDLVISNAHSIAHGVLTAPGQIHVTYVNRTMRYAWDRYHDDLVAFGLNRGMRGIVARIGYHYLRQWDWIAYQRPDHVIANSQYVGKRLEDTYRRSSDVIYPPVDVSPFSRSDAKTRQAYYIFTGRLVPYKHVDLLIKAFNACGLPLLIVGDGPSRAHLQSMARENIQFLGWQPAVRIGVLLREAKAFVFAAEEEFGIAPVEAQACGTPVIALARGGAAETIRGVDSPMPTGVLFRRPEPECLIEAVGLFERNVGEFSPESCLQNALRFSPEAFRSRMSEKIARLTGTSEVSTAQLVHTAGMS